MICKCILVIEDDLDIQTSIKDVLETEGYAVFCAKDGKEAIGLLPTLPHPPLILLDMMMPIMSGWEFLEAQKANAQFADIPVVLVSAVDAGSALVTDAGPVRAEGHLRKPVNLESLLKVVSKYCLPLHALEEENHQAVS